ncbi:MAG: putative nicotinate-nucleotide pyrophosphorylase [carboxylating] [Fimbriimonadaceae bacterium]|nr:putative nicotinate-nucleotide pyrophosphorylase [carboxylating] [Fimbriimonadaceae bacterium]
MNGLDPLLVENLVRAALEEDLGSRGDLTGEATIPADLNWKATIVGKERGVLCGIPFLVSAMAQRCVSNIVITVQDGEVVEPGTKIASVSGLARGIVSAERVALNFLGRLSGIATLTSRFVDAVAGTQVRITDTRKTSPSLRMAEKYAVRCGGGINHRMGLFDAVLIKDNHVAACGGVGEAVRRAKAAAGHLVKVEVEITRVDQLQDAILAGADVVMLDNFAPADCRVAVAEAAGRVVLEASGGIRLENVREYAETGVDVISVGALTHSAPSFDVALDFAGS